MSGLLLVRPAWASTRRWKSSRELVTASEVNRRASDREAGVKEAGERSCGPTDRNWIRGGAEQGERASDREALVTKARQRKSGGRAAKADGLTRGDLALRLKGRRSVARPTEREVSRGHSSGACREGPNDGKGAMLMFLGDWKPQKSSSNLERTTSQSGEAAMTAGRVGISPTGNEHWRPGACLNPSNRPVRTRMPGGVAGDAEV
jgi:hypothetical protein